MCTKCRLCAGGLLMAQPSKPDLHPLPFLLFPQWSVVDNKEFPMRREV